MKHFTSTCGPLWAEWSFNERNTSSNNNISINNSPNLSNNTHTRGNRERNGGSSRSSGKCFHEAKSPLTDQSITHPLSYFHTHPSPSSSSQCKMGNLFTLLLLCALVTLSASFPKDDSANEKSKIENLLPLAQSPDPSKEMHTSSNPLHFHSHRLKHEKNFRLVHLDSLSPSSASDEILDSPDSLDSPGPSFSALPVSPPPQQQQQSVTWSNTDSPHHEQDAAAATVLKITSSSNVHNQAHVQNRTRTQYFRSHRISRSGPTLEIQPSGGVQKVQAGNPFVISCMGSGADVSLFSELTWYNPRGQVIESNSRSPEYSVTLSNSGNKKMLVFKNIKYEDEGTYTCKGVFQQTIRLEEKVRFIIYEGIQWKECPQYQALVKGREGEMIRCTAQAKPKADLTWVKNETEIDTQRYSTESGGIKIRGTSSESDAGKYIIYATVTETGMVETREIQVEVHIKPTIQQITPSSPAHITEGEIATFRCLATASPYATYSWIGPSQRNLSSASGYIVDPLTGQLTIQQVSKRDDHGPFKCVASNAAGSDEKSIQVTVYTKPVVEKFDMNPTQEGAEAYINCIATGNPPPKISIKKEGHEDRVLYSGQRRIQLETRPAQRDEVILTGKIISIERSDSGIYSCVAENQAATVHKETYLEVRYKPDLSETVRSVKSWNGHTVNLTCNANSIPNASVTWLRPNGDIIMNDRYYQVFKYPGRADLQVKSIDQIVYGNYKCRATNEIGENEVHVSLSEAFVPGSIPAVRLAKKTTQSVLFEITPPTSDGGLPVRHYHVKYGISGTLEYKNWTWPATTGDINGGYFIDRLEPEREYWFKFAAENEVGRGPYSADTVVNLPKESVPEPVVFTLEDPKFNLLNGELTSQFNREFTLRWNEPSDNGRKIESYEIKYYKVKRASDSGSDYDWRSEGSPHQASVPATDQLTYTLKNLQPNTYYKVEITARNALGTSSPSKLVFKTADIHDATDLYTRITELFGANGGYKDGRLNEYQIKLLITIIILAIIVFFILADLICCFAFQAGILYYCSSCFSSSHSSSSSERRSIKSDSSSMQKEPSSLDDKHNDSPVANREEECTPLNHSKIPAGAVALPGPQSPHHQLVQQSQQQQQQQQQPQLLHQQAQHQQQQQQQQLHQQMTQQQQQLLSHHYHSQQRSLLTTTGLNHQQLNLTSNSSTIV